MAIRNGDLADADSLLNNVVGTQFRNFSNLLYNSAYIGFNSKLNVATGVPNLKNIKYDVFNSDTAMTKTGWLYDGTNKYYIPDISDEASGDTTHNPNSLSDPENAFDGNAATYSTGSNGALGKTFGAKTVVMAKVIANVTISTTSGTQQNGSGSLVLEKYDGSTWSTIATLASASSTTIVNGSPLSISYSGYIVVNESMQGIRVNMNGSGGGLTSATRLYSLEYGVYAETNSLIFQTTSLPTITDCIPTWNASIDGDNTLTVSISADGTNYEEVTDATIHRFTNTGTNLYIKFEIDRVDTSAVDKISEYAILYNVGAA